MGRRATTCWSCDERALAVVARRRGRVVAGLCDGCARYDRLLRAFATAVAVPAPPGDLRFQQVTPRPLLSFHRVFR